MVSVLFICGCGHSGTTLIANMLASHPEAYVLLEETHMFVPIEDFDEFERSYFINKRKSSFNEIKLLEGYIDEAKKEKKKIFVEKTPRHVRYVHKIRNLIPGSRFLIPVRDGRDVAASYIKRTGNALDGLERWEKDNAHVLREQGSKDVFVFRYEDLISETKKTVNSICQFLDIDYNDEVLNYHRTERLWFGRTTVVKGDGRRGVGHFDLRNWQVNQPIFDGRGIWKEHLKEKELEKFRLDPVYTLMKAFNYI